MSETIRNPITLVSERELRQVIDVSEGALEQVAQAFVKLAQGNVTQPPIMRIDVPAQTGELDIKSAYIKGLDSFAVKMSSGFFANTAKGLPSMGGLMILFSSETGFVQALLLDNGYLTDIRTALAGALAAKHLANERVNTVGIIGTGGQARYQLQALKLVRDFQQVLVWGRNDSKAHTYAEKMSRELAISVTACPGDEDARASLVSKSDLVITTTPSTKPLIRADWLHAGLHITAMGSDAEHKNELEPAVLARTNVFCCDTVEQSKRLGELHHALADFPEVETKAITLGDLIAGNAQGRSNESDITVCDLTGTGVQDTAIARFAFEHIRANGAGTQFET
jgi:ornithine cyclodeaminase